MVLKQWADLVGVEKWALFVHQSSLAIAFKVFDKIQKTFKSACTIRKEREHHPIPSLQSEESKWKCEEKSFEYHHIMPLEEMVEMRIKKECSCGTRYMFLRKLIGIIIRVFLTPSGYQIPPICEKMGKWEKSEFISESNNLVNTFFASSL